MAKCDFMPLTRKMENEAVMGVLQEFLQIPGKSLRKSRFLFPAAGRGGYLYIHNLYFVFTYPSDAAIITLKINSGRSH